MFAKDAEDFVVANRFVIISFTGLNHLLMDVLEENLLSSFSQ